MKKSPFLASRRNRAALGGGLAAALLVGVVMTNSGPSAEEAAASQQPPPASVRTVQPESVQLWSSYSGRLSAIDTVEIRPQVSGTIQQVLFEDGAQVQAGQRLFVIDPRPFEASLAQADAALAAARSEVRLAQVELKRADKLVKSKYVSESLHDERRNTLQRAEAALRVAEAQQKVAKLNLEYANITAPITGRISRAELTEGNLVEAGQNAPVLATIVSNDPIYAEFEVDEQTYLNSLSHAQQNSGTDMPVELKLAGDTKVYQGRIHSFDNRLDPTSGTLRARAVFENPEGVLIPGLYADIRLGESQLQQAMVLPDSAIGTNQDQKFVYVVDEKSQIAMRPVTLGRGVEGKRIIASGLNPGDRVVINGLQKVMPGMPVTPQEAPPQPSMVSDAR